MFQATDAAIVALVMNDADARARTYTYRCPGCGYYCTPAAANTTASQTPSISVD